MTKRKKPSEEHMFVYLGLTLSRERIDNAMTLVAQLQGIKEFPDSEDFVTGLDEALLDAVYALLVCTKDGLGEALKAHMGKPKNDA
jgi:hypothetical protein